MHLIRILMYLAAQFDFWFRAEHNAAFKPTPCHIIKWQHSSYRTPQRTHIPAALVALMAQSLTWTSTTCSPLLFSSSSPSHKEDIQSCREGLPTILQRFFTVSFSYIRNLLCYFCGLPRATGSSSFNHKNLSPWSPSNSDSSWLPGSPDGQASSSLKMY